jgi:hypothetical protein
VRDASFPPRSAAFIIAPSSCDPVPLSRSPPDYVPRADYDDQTLEVHGLREQLVGVLEELAARERELAEEQSVHHRYLSKMQTYSDQVMEPLAWLLHRGGRGRSSGVVVSRRGGG